MGSRVHLGERLDLVVDSMPGLADLLESLCLYAASFAPSTTPDRWRWLVGQYVLPLVEPLAKSAASTYAVDAAMRAQTAALVVERLLDDVEDGHARHDLDRVIGRFDVAMSAVGAPRNLSLGSRSHEGDPTVRAGTARTPLLLLIPQLLVRDQQDWIAGYEALLGLSFLLDDIDDVLEDLAAGRRTWVCQQIEQAGWRPDRLDLGNLLALRLTEAKTRLLRQAVGNDAEYPLLSAIAVAMAPGAARQSGALNRH